MTYALKTADAKFIMTGPSSLDIAVAAAKNVGIPHEHVFLLEGEVAGYSTFKQLQDVGKSYGTNGQVPRYQIPSPATNKDICFSLNFSSGTTGLPKAVGLDWVSTRRNAEGRNILTWCPVGYDLAPQHNCAMYAGEGRSTIRAEDCLGRTSALPQLVSLFATPPGRDGRVNIAWWLVTGLIRFCNTPVFFNDEMVLLPQFNLEDMLKAIVEFQVQEMALVPPLVIRLVNDPIVDKYDLSCLKRLSSGAAPLSAELTQQLEKKFPYVGFRQGYGMTESTSCITCHSPKYYDFKYASTVGDIVPSTFVKIVDPDTGKELGYNQPGEILAKGPQIAMGYLKNPKATEESFDKDGFLHTGDIGSINEEGLITILDRIKEMIKVKGIAVAPAELEDILLGHADVADCAVLGVPDDYAGERPKAYVVLRPGLQPSEAVGRTLLQYVQERKVRFKWLSEIEFTEVVPKSASGKILRRVLKEKERSSSNHGLVVRDEKERARL
jgi:acyl-CoA synthetase (AMP-forming)/AMP-acid ligase II